MAIEIQPMVLRAECDWCGRKVEWTVPAGHTRLLPPTWDTTLKYAVALMRLRPDVTSEVICSECDAKAMHLVSELRKSILAKRSPPPNTGEATKEN